MHTILKKTVLITKISERTGISELFFAAPGRWRMTDFADIYSWIALKYETEMVDKMCITFFTVLENNTTLFTNQT